MRRFPFAILLAATVACGGDSPSGPDTPSVAGTWRFSYNNMSGVVQGVSVSCNAAALDFALSQSGTTFSGAQVGVGRLLCFAQGQTIVDELIGSETLVAGSINGPSISFRLGTIAGQHNGTVSGGSMTGTATWSLNSGSVTVTLNGQFTAVRL
jgi:hypothetical protein